MSAPRYGDRYEVQELLGQGAMGRVYRARDLQLAREVALKVVTNRGGTSLERFRREGEVTASLRHPGIVGVHAFGEQGEEAYLAYELIPEARTLRDVAPTLEREAALSLLRDVARALGYAHAQGVTHRDVKPDNVLVTPDGAPKVADFGLAMAQGQERLTRTGALVGTPFYMAPEQFAHGGAPLGPPADVWALGVILYELLTEALPFEGSSILELGARIMRAEPTRPSEIREDVPQALEAILDKALSPDPADRYPEGDAFADDLERFLRGEDVLAGPPRRRRQRAFLIALLLPLAGVGVALAWLATRPAPHGGPAASAGASQARARRLETTCDWTLTRGELTQGVGFTLLEVRGDAPSVTLQGVRLRRPGDVPLDYDTTRDDWLPLGAALGKRFPLEGPRVAGTLRVYREEVAPGLKDAAEPVRASIAEAFDEARLGRHLATARALATLDGTVPLEVWPEPGLGLACKVSVTRHADSVQASLAGWERLEPSSGPKVREPELSLEATLVEGRLSAARVALSWRESGGQERARFELRYTAKPAQD